MNRNQNDRILRSVSNRRRRREYNPVPLWIFLALLIVALVVILSVNLSKSDTPADIKGDETTAAVGDVTVTEEPEPYPGYVKLTLPESELHRGDLILVNSANEFIFPEDADIITFYGHKNDNYKLAETSLAIDAFVLSVFNDMLTDFASTMDRKDVIVNSGYRSLEDQQSIYDSRLAAYGQNYVDSYVAKPGFSEHHTGYALDMAVYTDAGVSMTFDQDTDFNWFFDASHSYGFILRYAANKVEITGISNEPWHFRYVGKPHAYYMYANDLCLEEYIDLIRRFKFDEQHLTFRDDEEQEWEIYFVPAAGEETEVYVPSEYPYTLSGNNCDGFIVTVER